MHQSTNHHHSTTALDIFKYQQQNVRIFITNDEIWFVASDTCAVLGIVDYIQAVERLDDDERGRYNIPTPGGSQNMLCVNEPGLYGLILTSRKPEAKAFKRWIKHEVLPSIRKTGKYSIPQDGIALTEVIERIQGHALAHLINNPQELHQTIETTKQNIKTLQQNLNLLQVTEQHLYPEQAPKAQIEAPEEVLKRKVLHIMQRKTKAARTKEEQWISPAVVHNQVKYNRYSIEEVEALMKTLNLEYKKTKHAPRGKYRLK